MKLFLKGKQMAVICPVFEDMDISEESDAADIFSETPEEGEAESFDTAGDSADISDFDMPEDFDSGLMRKQFLRMKFPGSR